MAARAWQRMLSGRRLDLLDPSPLDVEIVDIAHGLARVARWNGQTAGEHAFSVAQHSLLVTAIFDAMEAEADPARLLAALLHDAPEYVVGDMISPFKATLGPEYRQVEARVQGAVHLRFGLPARTPQPLLKAIKKADSVAAYLEATRLAGFSETEARRFFGKPVALPRSVADLLEPMAAPNAQAAFLARFEAIEKLRGGQAGRLPTGPAFRAGR